MVDERGHTCVIPVSEEQQNVNLNTESNKLAPSHLGIALEVSSSFELFFIANELYYKYNLFISLVLLCSAVVSNQ